MDNIEIINKTKEPRYVTVYNKLFKMIQEGDFPEGCRLPSEPDLARTLEVSRTTLRQALALLQDDGLVKNLRGKGNYIIKEKPKRNIGLEKIGNISYKCLDIDIDSVEIDFRLEPPSDYYTKVLERKTAATVCVDRWYKSKGNYVAYTFSILPIETISEENIDLNNKDALLTFLEKDIYDKCSSTSLEIKFSTSGAFTSRSHPISCENKFYLIEEGIYLNSEFPSAFNKHYLPLQYTTIKLHPTKQY